MNEGLREGLVFLHRADVEHVIPAYESIAVLVLELPVHVLLRDSKGTRATKSRRAETATRESRERERETRLEFG